MRENLSQVIALGLLNVAGVETHRLWTTADRFWWQRRHFVERAEARAVAWRIARVQTHNDTQCMRQCSNSYCDIFGRERGIATEQFSKTLYLSCHCPHVHYNRLQSYQLSYKAMNNFFSAERVIKLSLVPHKTCIVVSDAVVFIAMLRK